MTRANNSTSKVGNRAPPGDRAVANLRPGIAYQRDEHDPLLDTEQCNRDAKLMAEVGANAIRVYHLDTEGDHQGCLDAFGNAGIYAFVDLDTFATQIEASTALHWNQTQYDRFAAVLDEFIKFDNVAGVFVGNEVLTRANESLAAPYVRAAARDLKAYRDAKGYRKIPIGYSAGSLSSPPPSPRRLPLTSDSGHCRAAAHAPELSGLRR